MRLIIDNGKYTFLDGEGGDIDVLRYGEPWVTIGKGSNAVRALMAEADELRGLLAEAGQHLKLPDSVIRFDTAEEAVEAYVARHFDGFEMSDVAVGPDPAFPRNGWLAQVVFRKGKGDVFGITISGLVEEDGPDLRYVPVSHGNEVSAGEVTG